MRYTHGYRHPSQKDLSRDVVSGCVGSCDCWHPTEGCQCLQTSSLLELWSVHVSVPGILACLSLPRRAVFWWCFCQNHWISMILHATSLRQAHVDTISVREMSLLHSMLRDLEHPQPSNPGQREWLHALEFVDYLARRHSKFGWWAGSMPTSEATCILSKEPIYV